MINQILDWLYPRRCPLCGEIAWPRGVLACPACVDAHASARVHEPVCLQCGKALESDQKLYCMDCSDKSFQYERGYALWNYDAVMRRSIGQYKYQGRREYADFYAEEFIAAYGKVLSRLDLSAIVPVPIHRHKMRMRGFNQAELLAERIANALKLPLLTDYLIRHLDTAPQKDLNPEERRRNLYAAFSVDTSSPHYRYRWKRVLLVDDIYTTGSTIDACARVLRQAGTETVYAMYLCIGQGA